MGMGDSDKVTAERNTVVTIKGTTKDLSPT
jgi:hypothetical protein